MTTWENTISLPSLTMLLGFLASSFNYDGDDHVDHVKNNRVTGHEKIVYVGHSQGNAQAFIGLAQDPLVANKLTAFIALAPAFYIGRLG